MELPVLALIAASTSGLAAAISATVAFVATRRQRVWNTAQAFLSISATFEDAEMRRIRRSVYLLDRHDYQTWTAEQREDAGAWLAHLDLVSVLMQAQQLNRIAVLDMYGDVLFRTIYQLAPYVNADVAIRGPQFLLPVRKSAREMASLWHARSRREQYPREIGFPAQPNLRLTPKSFRDDPAVKEFSTFRSEMNRR